MWAVVSQGRWKFYIQLHENVCAPNVTKKRLRQFHKLNLEENVSLFLSYFSVLVSVPVDNETVRSTLYRQETSKSRPET